MKAIRLLTLLLILQLPAQAPYDDLREKAAKFATAHNKFVRELFGCPQSIPLTAGSCSLSLGIVNYGEFLRARKLAASLYSLKSE